MIAYHLEMIGCLFD